MVEDLMRLMDEIIPDDKILTDVSNLIWMDSREPYEIELDSKNIFVPYGTAIVVITKAFVREYFAIAFNTGFRVMLGVGDLPEPKFGILQPEYCFVTIYYHFDGRMITCDFHEDMR